MTSLPKVTKTTSDLSDRTLTINLVLKSPGNISIRSCEVLGRGFRNRLSFHDEGTLENILVGKLAQSIRAALRTIPEGSHVLALPEFLLELPGLALYGAHVMVMDAKDGIRNAILRFKEFLGSANSAFLPDVGFDQTASTHSERLAMNVLEELCMPILNMCHAFDTMARDQGQSVPAKVTDRAREFQFQTELLKRFIFNAQFGQADASQQHLATPEMPDRLYLS